MKDKEKLIKLKKLADAMYYAAQYLTTDASRLHKAMDEYHKFTIHECKEEPVSEDLEKASKEWLIPQLDKSYANYGEAKMIELTHFDGYAMLDAIEFGAKWQEKQDQSTIELAEDHAMFAGMEKMKEEMMEKAKSGTVQKDNQVILDDGTYMDLDPSMQLKPSFVGLKEGDRIKVIVIKED